MEGHGTLPQLEISRGSRRISLSHPLIAAPMAGAFDPPFRKLLHKLGIELSFTEMISARGAYEDSKRTVELSGWIPETGHSVAQIFGSKPNYLEPAAERMENIGHHAVDLNTGCPKRKVLSGGAGGAMLKEPDNLLKCLSAILDSVKVPVGFKTRSGFHAHEKRDFIRLLREAEGIGISYVAVHPRTVVQGFRGEADRNVINTASSEVDIPIIASGDVRSLTDVNDYLNRGASGVMIGRAMFGDPFLTERILNGDDRHFPSTSNDIENLMNNAKIHLKNSVDYFGEKRGLVKFRTHFSWYVKGFRSRNRYAGRIYHITKLSEALELMDEIQTDWKG
jgi:tRNA-dihydrouridine synthase B